MEYFVKISFISAYEKQFFSNMYIPEKVNKFDSTLSIRFIENDTIIIRSTQKTYIEGFHMLWISESFKKKYGILDISNVYQAENN